MRLSLFSLAVTFPLLVAPPAAGQAPDTVGRSLLAPGRSEAPPPPVPLPSESSGPSIVPPASDSGPTAITAVPLPPPGPPPPPVPPALPWTGAPSVGAPISLAAPAPLKPAGKPAAAPAISAGLPIPALSPEANPADFLRAARTALVEGRTGEARSALEMAQTRLLDRSVDAGQERVPSDDRAVRQISGAIAALTANDKMTCLSDIESASRTIGSPLD